MGSLVSKLSFFKTVRLADLSL